MLRQGNILGRYKGEKFESKQAQTEQQRRELLDVLHLNKGDESWFEIMTKKSLSEYSAISELGNIENLLLVKFIEKKDQMVPKHIVDKVRGTIIWGKKVILRNSIPYREEVKADELEVKDGVVQFNFGLSSRSINVEDLFIRPYHNGSIISIMKINGVVQWFTTSNLLPKGVRIPKEGRWLHEPARWGHGAVFTTSFENICKKADPNLLIDDKLFPRDCMFSNREYRFVLTTRQTVRCDADSVGENGYMTYLGCFEHWSNISPPEELAGIMGSPHTSDAVYHPVCTTIKLDGQDSFILGYTKGMSLKDANRYLAGKDVGKGVFSGGGKLIITGKVKGRGGYMNDITFHVSSSSYRHRELVLGNEPDLYKQFLSLLTFTQYDFGNSDSVALFRRKIKPLKSPDNPNDMAILDRNVHAYNPIYINEKNDMMTLIKDEINSLVWYNFLACTNVSVRPTVFTFLERFYNDMIGSTKWVLNIGKHTDFSGLVKRSFESKDQIIDRKIEEKKNFLFEIKRTMLSKVKYNKTDAEIPGIAILIQLEFDIPKLISLYHRVVPEKHRESIRKTYADAKFMAPMTYKDVLIEGKR